MMLVVLLTFTGLVTGLGVLLTLVVVRLAPPQRVRRVLQALGALVGAVIYAAFYITFYGKEGGPLVGSEQVSSLEQIFGHPLLEWFPSGWASSSVTFFVGQEDIVLFGIKFGLLILSTLGVFLICQNFLQEGFRKGMLSVRAIPSKKKGSEVKLSTFPSWSFIPRPYYAIMLKEYKIYLRNLQVLSKLFFPLAASVVIPVIIFIQSGETGPVTSYIGLVAAWFFMYTVGAFILSTSFTLERKSFWVLLASPMGGKRLIQAKALTYYIPITMGAEVYHLVGSLMKDATIKWMLSGAIVIPLVSLGLVSFVTIISAAYGQFYVIDIRKGLPGAIRLLTTLLVVFYLGLVGLGLVCMLYGEPLPYVDRFGMTLRRMGGTLVLILTLAAALYLPLRLLGKKVTYKEWRF